MLQRREARKEYVTGCGFGCGALLVIIGLPITFMGFGSGALRATYTRDPSTGAITDGSGFFLMNPGLGLIGLGILVCCFAAGYGWYQHINRNKGATVSYPDAFVISRYAINKQQDLLTQSWEFDYEDLKFFVRIQLDAANVLELETSRDAFEGCGEGMRGVALVHGKWLGGFAPHAVQGINRQDDRLGVTLDQPLSEDWGEQATRKRRGETPQ